MIITNTRKSLFIISPLLLILLPCLINGDMMSAPAISSGGIMWNFSEYPVDYAMLDTIDVGYYGSNYEIYCENRRGFAVYQIPEESIVLDRVYLNWTTSPRTEYSYQNFSSAWVRSVVSTDQLTWQEWNSKSKEQKYAALKTGDSLYTNVKPAGSHDLISIHNMCSYFEKNRGQKVLWSFVESPERTGYLTLDKSTVIRLSPSYGSFVGLTVYYVTVPLNPQTSGNSYETSDVVHCSWDCSLTDTENINFRIQFSQEPDFPDDNRTKVYFQSKTDYFEYAGDIFSGTVYWRVQARNKIADTEDCYGLSCATSEWTSPQPFDVKTTPPTDLTSR